VRLVLDRAEVRESYAAKYRAWQSRFNSRDDGGSAARIVRRLLDRKAIG